MDQVCIVTITKAEQDICRFVVHGDAGRAKYLAGRCIDRLVASTDCRLDYSVVPATFVDCACSNERAIDSILSSEASLMTNVIDFDATIAKTTNPAKLALIVKILSIRPELNTPEHAARLAAAQRLLRKQEG
jgi:hypothetical protein